MTLDLDQKLADLKIELKELTEKHKELGSKKKIDTFLLEQNYIKINSVQATIRNLNKMKKDGLV